MVADCEDIFLLGHPSNTLAHQIQGAFNLLVLDMFYDHDDLFQVLLFASHLCHFLRDLEATDNANKLSENTKSVQQKKEHTTE